MRRFQQALIGLYAITVLTLAVLYNFILIDGLHSPWAILTWTSGSLSIGLFFGLLLPMARWWRLMPSTMWKTHLTEDAVIVKSAVVSILLIVSLNLLALFPILVYYQPEITGGSPNLLAILISIAALLITVMSDAWILKYSTWSTEVEITQSYILFRSNAKLATIVRFNEDTTIRAREGNKAGFYFQNAKRTAHREKFFSNEMTQRTNDFPFLSAHSLGEEGFLAACRILNVDVEYPVTRDRRHYC